MKLDRLSLHLRMRIWAEKLRRNMARHPSPVESSQVAICVSTALSEASNAQYS